MTSPIAYSPKTWADLPAGNTPITAAELNRLERGVRDAARLTDRPGGFTSLDPPTRRASFAFGCGGEGTFTNKNTGFQRMPFQIPVQTTRWRMRISNRTPAGVSTGAGAVTYGPFYLMTAFRNLTTGEPNQWSGTPVLVHASSGSQAANTEWVSQWITGSTQQIAPNTLMHLQMQWSKAAGSTVYMSSGGSFLGTGTDYTSTTPNMLYQGTSAFAVQIEYEFVGNNKILVAVGDSITEGTQSRFNFMSWHQQLSQRLQMPVCLSAQFGSFGGTNMTPSWASGAITEPRYKRLADADCNIDAAIIFLGTNDTAFGNTLANFQDGVMQVSSRVRSEWGVRDVYWTTIPPQNNTSGSARENLRASLNTWLRSGNPPVTGVYDVARYMESTPNGLNLIPGLEGTGPDYTHFGLAGHMRFIDAIQIGT